jgi:hypothetical protein
VVRYHLLQRRKSLLFWSACFVPALDIGIAGQYRYNTNLASKVPLYSRYGTAKLLNDVRRRDLPEEIVFSGLIGKGLVPLSRSPAKTHHPWHQDPWPQPCYVWIGSESGKAGQGLSTKFLYKRACYGLLSCSRYCLHHRPPSLSSCSLAVWFLLSVFRRWPLLAPLIPALGTLNAKVIPYLLRTEPSLRSHS